MQVHAELSRADLARSMAQQLIGCSDDAWRALVGQIGQVRLQPREAFGLATDLEVDDPSVQVGERVKMMRAFVRRLGAVFCGHRDLDTMALQVHGILDPLHLTVQDVRELLAKDAHLLPVMAQAARMLRDGHPYRHVCDQLGASEWLVREVQTFLGVSQWRRDELAEEAARANRQGLSASQFARRWNDGRPEPGWIAERTARRLLQEVRG